MYIDKPIINCIYLDWGSRGKCKLLPKVLGIFRRNCPEILNKVPKTCTLHKEFEFIDPLLPPGPPQPPQSPPCRVYKCYGSTMVRTKESIQASYEWNCKLIRSTK